ncbi:MAG: desulfoferrodoxin family protein [Oscillospiraceae bacterium]
MVKSQKFYVCEHCGNMISMIKNVGVPIHCCGKKMNELVPNTTDASTEKHIPEVTISGNKVEVVVGSVIHPMTDEHLIEWIYLETEKGGQILSLKSSDEPKATFTIENGDKAVALYEYCNLHGLWKKEV